MTVIRRELPRSRVAGPGAGDTLSHRTVEVSPFVGLLVRCSRFLDMYGTSAYAASFTIRAQTKPHSSRATAVTATCDRFPRPTRRA